MLAFQAFHDVCVICPLCLQCPLRSLTLHPRRLQSRAARASRADWSNCRCSATISVSALLSCSASFSLAGLVALPALPFALGAMWASASCSSTSRLHHGLAPCTYAIQRSDDGSREPFSLAAPDQLSVMVIPRECIRCTVARSGNSRKNQAHLGHFCAAQRLRQEAMPACDVQCSARLAVAD
jgi:hypothetical protein